MLASIIKDTDKIQGFHSDDYSFGNSEHPDKLVTIKSFADGIDIETLTVLHKSGAYNYTLDAQGIVQQTDITKEPEYKKYQVEKLVAKKMIDIALDAVAEENPDLAFTAINMKEE